MLSTFAGHVGEEFQLHDRSGELHPVELVDAIGQASRQATEEQPTDTSSFSIVFHDPGLPPSRTWSSRCIESSTPSSANSTCSLFPSVPMQTETECNMRQFSRRLANTTEQYTSDTSSFLQSWHGALVEHRTVGPLFLLCRGSFSFRVPATSVRLLRLAPASVVKEHRDHALGLEDGEARLHIPIATGPKCRVLPKRLPHLDVRRPNVVPEHESATSRGQPRQGTPGPSCGRLRRQLLAAGHD